MSVPIFTIGRVSRGDTISQYLLSEVVNYDIYFSHSEFIKDGVKHMRMKFYIEGPTRRGTVNLEVYQVFDNLLCTYINGPTRRGTVILEAYQVFVNPSCTYIEGPTRRGTVNLEVYQVFDNPLRTYIEGPTRRGTVNLEVFQVFVNPLCTYIEEPTRRRTVYLEEYQIFDNPLCTATAKVLKFRTHFSCSHIDLQAIRTEIHKMIVRIANWMEPDQTASSEAV